MSEIDQSEKPALYGPRFEEALIYAAMIHRRQRRKGTEVPYIGHLLGVASLVIEAGGDEDLAIAALLHDAAEDQGGRPRLEDVRKNFGDRVARIVEGCSDAFADEGGDKPDWYERKKAYIEGLEDEDPSMLKVSVADKLFNARAIRRDYIDDGERLWARFNSGPDDILWYYRSLSSQFQRLLPHFSLTDELAGVVADLERRILVGRRSDPDD